MGYLVCLRSLSPLTLALLSMSSLLGHSFIGFARGQSTAAAYRAINPATATSLEPDFFPATAAEADRACALAAQATPALAALSGKQKAAFLRDIAVMLIEEGSKWIKTPVADLPVPPPKE